MTSSDSSVFVWTEVFNCGELARTFCANYERHGSYPIHILGSQHDIRSLGETDLIRPRTLAEVLSGSRQSRTRAERWVLSGYQSGHKGTARLWAALIKDRSEQFFVHIDSDVIVLRDPIVFVVNSLRNGGNNIAGPRRAYRYNLNGVDRVRHKPDCVDTLCFGFRREIVKARSRRSLARRIAGVGITKRIFSDPTLDFFDEVTFELTEDGKIGYLDSPHLGKSGRRDNDSPFMGTLFELWSAVGSGYAFRKKAPTRVPKHYVDYAIYTSGLYERYIRGKSDAALPSLPDSDPLTIKLLKMREAGLLPENPAK